MVRRHFEIRGIGILKMNKMLLATFLLVLSIQFLFSQVQELPTGELTEIVGSQVRLRTDGGATFQGVLFSVTDKRVEILDRSGEILTILKSEVKEVFKMDPDSDKRSYFQDSAANRLIVMPTGFPMETGEFHIADQEIAAVTVSYGVNQNFSLWGGISIPGALVSARFIIGLGERAALSIGSFAGLSWIEFMGLLIPYAVFSVGQPETNFTAGAGAVFAFTESNFSMDAAILTLGGKWILSDTTAIVTENWIVWGKMTHQVDIYTGESSTAWDYVPVAAVPGAAFRIAGEKFSWDIGAVLPIFVKKESSRYVIMGLGGEGIFIPLPLISLTYRID